MDRNFKIRPASAEDIPLIHEMADTVFRETYKDILSPEQMEFMMDWMYSEPNILEQMNVLNHKYFIAEEDGRACGYMSIEREAPSPEDDAGGLEQYHLQKLYVLPSHQGRGYGRELLQEAMRFVREISTGTARINLNVNRHNKAVGFYEKMGMECTSQGDFPIGSGFFMNDYIYSIDIKK